MSHRHRFVWSNIERRIYCKDITCDYNFDATQILEIVQKSCRPTKRVPDGVKSALKKSSVSGKRPVASRRG